MHQLLGGGGNPGTVNSNQQANSLAKAISMPSLPVLAAAAAAYPAAAAVLNNTSKTSPAPPSPPSHQKLLCQQFLSAHHHPATAAVAAADFYSSLTRVIIKIFLIIFLYQLFTVTFFQI